MKKVEELLMGVPRDEALVPQGTIRWILDACDILRQLQNPSPGLLASIALRLDHSFAMPDCDVMRQRMLLADAQRVWEEVSGNGFYTRELEAQYARYINPAALEPQAGPTLEWANEDELL